MISLHAIFEEDDNPPFFFLDLVHFWNAKDSLIRSCMCAERSKKKCVCMSAENGRKGGSLNIPTMHFA